MAAGAAHDERRRLHRELIVALGIGVASAGDEFMSTALKRGGGRLGVKVHGARPSR
jgi:hypothetical protein